MKSENLFHLIKSLSGNEKRYFVLFASLQLGDKKYIQLFHAIAKQKKYDEEQIIEQFKEHTFIKQFSVVKNYLYNLVLKSMEASHSSVNSKLHSCLHRIEMLADKGLYQQCEHLLKSAKALAERYEYHTLLLELLRWEKRLSTMQVFIGKTEQDVKQLYAESSNVIAQYKNLDEYLLQESLLFLRMQQDGLLRSSEGMNIYKDIFEHPLFESEKTAISLFAKTSFYLCKGTFAQMQHDHEQAYSFIQKNIQLLRKNNHHLPERQYTYIIAFRNLLACQLHCKRYGEMLTAMKEIRHFLAKNKAVFKNSISTIRFGFSLIELAMYRNTGQFEKGMILIRKMEQEIGKHGFMFSNKDDEMVFVFYAASFYFATGDYHTANHYLNALFNQPIINTRADIYCFAQLLCLIVHIEIDNQDLLEYKIKSVYRFLQKRKHLYQIENIFLDFIKQYLLTPASAKNMTVAFHGLKKKMENIVQDPFERKALDYFDFVSWVESKIEKRTFAEVVREKAAVIQ